MSLFVHQVRILPVTIILDSFEPGLQTVYSFPVWDKQHLLLYTDAALLLHFMCPYVKNNACRFASLYEHK